MPRFSLVSTPRSGFLGAGTREPCLNMAAASARLNFLFTSMPVGEPVGEFYYMNLWIGERPRPYLGDSMVRIGDLGCYGIRCPRSPSESVLSGDLVEASDNFLFFPVLSSIY